jgi:hypothetical protein
MATETVIQQVGETPEIEAYRIGLLKSAKELSDKGITLPQSKIADFTGLQNASFNRVSDYYGQDGTGIAGYQPYMDQATANFTGAGTNLAASQDLTGTRVGNVLNTGIAGAVNPAIAASMLGGNYGMGAATQGIAGLSGLSNQYDPNSYQQYMDPYMNDVIQQQYQDIQRQGDIQKQGANAQAVGSGAFGGSRQGIQQAEINRNVLDQQARTGSQLRSAGYQNAQQQAQAAFENSRARQAQQAQLTGQLGQIGSQAGLQYGQQMGQLGLAGQELTGNLAMNYGQQGLQGAQMMGDLGTRQAALGELGQNMLTKDAELMYTLGGRQQAQQQAGLEATRSNQMAQLYEPYQRLGFLSDIYSKTPTTQQTISQSTSPSVSPFQQYLGLGIAGLSAGAGAAKAGLFG